MVKFKTLATMTSLLCLGLAAAWFAEPAWILTHWSLSYNYDGGFVARRMACLFVALAVILMTLRSTRSQLARQAVANGIIAACLSLIGLALYEHGTGHVGRGIFFAIGLESVLAAAFLIVVHGKHAPMAEDHPEPAAPAH